MSVFTKAIAGYQELAALNTNVLNELVREIRVGAKYTEDGVKKQKIKIVYKHDCYVDCFEDGELLPSAETMAEFRKSEAEMSEKWTDAPALPKAI